MKCWWQWLFYFHPASTIITVIDLLIRCCSLLMLLLLMMQLFRLSKWPLLSGSSLPSSRCSYSWLSSLVSSSAPAAPRPAATRQSLSEQVLPKTDGRKDPFCNSLFSTLGSEQQNTLLKDDRGTHSTIASRGNNPDLIPNPDTPGGNRKRCVIIWPVWWKDLDYDMMKWQIFHAEAAVC